MILCGKLESGDAVELMNVPLVLWFLLSERHFT